MELINAEQEQIDAVNEGRCGARATRPFARYKYCRNYAGARTEHLGVGRCSLHGGNSRIVTGRYSTIKKETINELVEEQLELDPDPLNTLEEIATLRALTIDFINRYEENNEMALAWHESYQPGMPHANLIAALDRHLTVMERTYNHQELAMDHDYQLLKSWLTANQRANPKPKQLLDISSAYKMLSEVTRMVERVGKLNSQNAVSRKDFVRVMTEVGNIIDQIVSDDRTKHKIKERIASMRLA